MENTLTRQRIDDFILCFRRIAQSCRIFPGESIAMEVLINPGSGYFHNRRTYKKIKKAMDTYEAMAGKTREIRESVSIRFHESTSKEKLKDEVLGISRTLASDIGVNKKILVLAGGDGFHKDVGHVIMNEDPRLLSQIILFRLPLGTGNDSPDVKTMTDACDLFLTKGSVKHESMIRVLISPDDIHYAFNVASFGIDAYICQLTNKLKRKIQGDIFKVMVDISALFYDTVYKTGIMRLEIRSRGKVIREKGRYLLTVFGREGGITYGGGRPILPDEENFLLTRYLTMGQRLKYKNLFMTGRHRDLTPSQFFQADEVVIESYNHPILLELDGEVIELNHTHFPLTLRRVPNAYQVLGFPKYEIQDE